MANPTYQQLLGVSTQDASAALFSLGILENMDARLSIQRILARLVERNNALIALGVRLKTYSIDVSIDNIDINTQRQTFTIAIDMGLTANQTENEPSI